MPDILNAYPMVAEIAQSVATNRPYYEGMHISELSQEGCQAAIGLAQWQMVRILQAETSKSFGPDVLDVL